MRQVGRHSFFVLAAMAAASVSLMACPATLDDECADNACDPAAQTDAGEDGRRDANTDPCVVNPSDPACMDETTAVFVSNDGNNGAEGTRAAPLKTLDAALEKVTDARRRIYVCEGTYAANVEIKTSVSLVGGFKCSWDATGAKVKIAPPKGIALRITKVDGPVVVQDVEIVGSADKDVKGDSAIAVFVSESKDVTFKNAALTAGDGIAGANGASRSNYNGANATVGGSASGSTGGVGPTCACLDQITSSTGGNGAAGSGAGLTNGAAVPAVGGPNGGGSPDTVSCNPGKVGADGVANGPGAAGTAAGKLTAAGWTAPALPTNAPNGNPGQGGGGGGAQTGNNFAGGAGGCGGCGGAGGTPGGHGGSSFALLAFNSSVRVEGGALTSKAGGRGGDGGKGEAGQGGGGAGSGICTGGVGGRGAGGSGAGGGAGGHSALVGYVGEEPAVTGATTTPGTKGPRGDGGDRGEGPGNPGAAGTPGPEGKAQGSLEL